MCVSHNTMPVVTAVVWSRYNEALQIDQMMVVPTTYHWSVLPKNYFASQVAGMGTTL